MIPPSLFRRALHLFLSGTLCLVALLMVGCGPSNHVRLRYTSAQPAQPLWSNAAPVAIIPFTDARSTQTIGTRADGTDFVPLTSVADWMTQALADELSRQGLQVRILSAREDATPDERVLSGEVRQVWLTQQNIVDYTIRMEATLAEGDAPPTTYRAEEQRQSVPSENVADRHLEETLRSLISSMVRDITRAITLGMVSPHTPLSPAHSYHSHGEKAFTPAGAALRHSIPHAVS